MHISYQPLWNTLKERGMRKEDLRLAAGLTTNMIANMGKGKNISMETLVRICEALNCGIMNVVRRHTTIEELTPTLLREFVEKIVVHECSYDENKTRSQDIEIYYSFVGKVELPDT